MGHEITMAWYIGNNKMSAIKDKRKVSNSIAITLFTLRFIKKQCVCVRACTVSPSAMVNTAVKS